MASRKGPTPRKKPRRGLATFATIYPPNGVHSWFFSCTLRTLLGDTEGIFDGSMIGKESGPTLDQSRNYLVKQFLESSPREWLMFLDSDERWEKDDLFDFIKRADAHPEQTPVVSGLYLRVDYEQNLTSFPMWLQDGSPVPLSISEETDYVRVGIVPAGALLIHRSVLLRMKEALGEEWFTVDRMGTGEDMRFCDRLAHLDIPVHVDPRFKVEHIKWIGLRVPGSNV